MPSNGCLSPDRNRASSSSNPTSTFPRRSIVNQPGVKAVHIINPSGKNFEGLNIYESNDEVRIYVVPLQAAPAPTKPAKKPADSKSGKRSR